MAPGYNRSVEITRTTSADPRFQMLAALLDAELVVRYGPVQDLYKGFNAFACETVIVAGELGCGCFKPFDEASVELKRMFVRREQRGRGIASAILGGLEAWARELGHTQMVLETGNLQTEAIAMYKKLGFVDTPLFGPYIDLPASVCLKKSLG